MQIFNDLEQVGSQRIDKPRVARPIISTLDTWDQDTQIEFHLAPHVGRRAGWNVPSVAITSESINTIRSSSRTRAVSPRIARRVGMTLDPSTVSPYYTSVPNMAQTIKSDSQVQVHFSMTARTANFQSPYFAVYRDGMKISQEYRSLGTTPTGPNTHDFLVSGSYVDVNPPPGWHTYELRWHVDPVAPGQLTAGSNNRTFQVSNLRAQ
jgi:hypothetical protein